jgi:hypothetical protein
VQVGAKGRKIDPVIDPDYFSCYTLSNNLCVEKTSMSTNFKGKSITRQLILKAMQDFDDLYPESNDYAGWLDDSKYKYKVHHQKRVYPPKHILSEASGISVSEFSGGEQTNRVFEQLGFLVLLKK